MHKKDIDEDITKEKYREKNEEKNKIEDKKEESCENLNFKVKTKRIEKAYNYLKSLPFGYRKYENCKAYMHSVRIAQKMFTESLIIISLFHDVLEDFGEEKKEELRKICTEEEIKIIEILTKKKDESYEVYISKITKNHLASYVKKHDMWDNFQTATPENKIKYQKYLLVLL